MSKCLDCKISLHSSIRNYLADMDTKGTSVWLCNSLNFMTIGPISLHSPTPFTDCVSVVTVCMMYALCSVYGSSRQL